VERKKGRKGAEWGGRERKKKKWDDMAEKPPKYCDFDQILKFGAPLPIP